jgi:hypothetical protein
LNVLGNRIVSATDFPQMMSSKMQGSGLRLRKNFSMVAHLLLTSGRHIFMNSFGVEARSGHIFC